MFPPYLYGLDQGKGVARIRVTYRGYGFGASGEAVRQCAISLQRERLYPERLAYRWEVLRRGRNVGAGDPAGKSPEAAPVAAIRAFSIVAPGPRARASPGG
jgi:hypothetical protein